MKVGIRLGETEGCCGVTQLFEFSYEWSFHYDPQLLVSDKTMERCYKALFEKLRKFNFQEAGDWGPVIQMWFQKNQKFDGTFEEEYLAEPLRLLIETIPGVICLGEYKNPNGGNMIRGYQWYQD